MKFNGKIRQDLVTQARAGNKRSACAKSVGISPATLNSWIQKGIRGDVEFAEFAEEYLKAEAKDETSLVSLLKESLVDGEGNPVPAVAMYLLNNRHGWNKVAVQVAEKFIDYLVDKLSESHPELLTSILQDLEGGVLD
jgi:hypothetical protein